MGKQKAPVSRMFQVEPGHWMKVSKCEPDDPNDWKPRPDFIPGSDRYANAFNKCAFRSPAMQDIHDKLLGCPKKVTKAESRCRPKMKFPKIKGDCTYAKSFINDPVTPPQQEETKSSITRQRQSHQERQRQNHQERQRQSHQERQRQSH